MHLLRKIWEVAHVDCAEQDSPLVSPGYWEEVLGGLVLLGGRRDEYVTKWDGLLQVYQQPE